MSSLRGLRAADAAWAPVGRKSIWEQALHAAYWKQRVLNRFSSVKRGEAFPRRPSNWPRLPERITERAWREDIQLLVDIHTKLRAAVARLPSAEKIPPKLLRAIYGVAFHDIYHAGQIYLLRRMRKSS